MATQLICHSFSILGLGSQVIITIYHARTIVMDTKSVKLTIFDPIFVQVWKIVVVIGKL